MNTVTLIIRNKPIIANVENILPPVGSASLITVSTPKRLRVNDQCELCDAEGRTANGYVKTVEAYEDPFVATIHCIFPEHFGLNE
jgi:hypothetical protein